MARVLNGKEIAAEIQQEIIRDIARVREVHPAVFRLVVVLVGNDPASASYVRGKQRTAEKVGIDGGVIHLPEDVQEDELLQLVDQLNADDTVDGILVQLPLPVHINEFRVLCRVSPEKDVDGFHPQNVGLNSVGHPRVWPCTPAGIMEILRRSEIPVAGTHAVVVGRSQIVGRPMSQLLLNHNATVTTCHSHTLDLDAYTATADILVVAAGSPQLITERHVKDGAVVIDVGVNRVHDKLVGDVDYEGVFHKVNAITPVPGGVGPLTTTMLMKNTVSLAVRRRGWVV